MGRLDRILALDLGTTTGWARWSPDRMPAKVELGQWVLASPKEITAFRKKNLDRRSDPRFRKLLERLRTHESFRLVIFEDVEFYGGSLYQVQLWATWRAAVWAVFPEQVLECLPVGTLKKFATGNGNAKKMDMARALLAAEPGRFSIVRDGPKDEDFWVIDNYASPGNKMLTHDAVDAYWLLQWARKNIKA